MKKRYILFCLPLISLTSCKISGNSTVQYAYEQTQSSQDFDLNIQIDKKINNTTYTQKYEYIMNDSTVHFIEDAYFEDGTYESRDVYRVDDICYEIKDGKYSSTACSFISQVDTLGSILSNYYVSLKTIQYEMSYNSELLMYQINDSINYSTIDNKNHIVSKMYVKVCDTDNTSTLSTSETINSSNNGKITYAKIIVDTYSTTDNTKLYDTTYKISINYGISLELPQELKNK